MTTLKTLSAALLVALCALLNPALAAQDGPSAGPLLTADPPQVDFGDAFQGEILDQVVTVKNDGDEPFLLGSIQTSCGCTAASILGPDGVSYPTRTSSNEPILSLGPGEEMAVTVEFRTQGKHGDIKQTMKVHHVDHQAVPPLEVGVTVRVSKALQVTPAWLNLNRISKTAVVEEEIVVEATEIGDWAITGFENQLPGQKVPPYLTFEVLDEEGPRRRIKVSIDGDRPVGPINARIRIGIDHERIEHVDFAVTAMVEPNVTFDSGNTAYPENLNFEQLKPEDKVTRTLTITNTDPAVPYDLQSVDLVTTKKDFFVTEIRTVEEGVSYEVDVTVDGSIGDPFFRGSIMLRALHPDVPNKMIPFHGWVRK